MEITERDIFNFVFFNNAVSPDKSIFIKDNQEYSPGLKFYIALKEAIEQNVTNEVKNRIKEKIPVYKSLIYILNPVKETARKKKPLA